jgi:dolichol kinase
VSAPDITRLGAVTGLLLAVLALAEVLRRRGVGRPEATRKLVHAVSGLVAATFPWLFTGAGSVIVLTASFAVVMGATRRLGLLGSVHGVSRCTEGGVYYPAAVLLLFLLAAHRPEAYVPAILVLSLADPAAALVGGPWGRTRYRVFGGDRSVEGSLAFAATALPCVFVPLAFLTALPLESLVRWSLHVTLLATILEALSPRGSDNLTIPLGSGLALLPVTTAPAPLAGLLLLPLASTGVLLALGRREAPVQLGFGRQP